MQDRLVNAWFAQATLPAPVDAALLQRHALRFAKGQSTDFFVHPQLGAVLRDELDHYLQTEFVHLWDVPDAALARERGKLAVARDIGRAIITVLAALEDLQAALFEKRRFVMQAHYLVMCSWLAWQGAPGAALVAQACEHAPQVARWRQWLGEPAGSTASGAALLARCPHLPLDTGLFDEAFQWAVLAEVPDVQGALGGLLVHGDNYAALRRLQAQWREAVKCVYIDPPYNTGPSEILYKNDLLHSSWSALMHSRLLAGRAMLSADGVTVVAIDKAENDNLSQVLAQAFADKERVAVTVVHNPRGVQGEFSFTNKFAHFAFAPGATLGMRQLPGEKAKPLMKTGSVSERGTAKNCFYPIYVSRSGLLLEFGDVPADSFHPSGSQVSDGERIALWPISTDGTERKWRYARQSVDAVRQQLEVRKSRRSGEYVVYLAKSKEAFKTVWTDAAYNAAEYGHNLLQSVVAAPFTFPKSVHLVADCISVSEATEPSDVLDYFAGSGTTAHAVINLNRDDGGTRRFILVEQGEYFDTVTLPRVAKVMACPEWKDGRPKDGVAHHPAEGDDADEHWAARTLPIVQVLRIERYEDSLDALALPGAVGAAGQGELAGFDALLRYVADTVADAQAPTNPVRLSTAALKRPLHYRLPTVWEGQAVERPVDLLHTTLLLLGLHLVRVRHLQRPPAAGGGAALLAEVRPHRLGQPAAAVPLELLLLREHDLEDLPPAQQAARARAEYDWLATAVQQTLGCTLASYARVHHNRDLLLPGDGEHGQSIDAALAAAMWQRDPAFSPPATAAVNATTGTPAALA